MIVNKTLIIVFFFFSATSFGQKSIYPKDTIYIAFKNNKKWFGDYGYDENKRTGILFNLKDKNNKSISFFFDENQKTDTLCHKHLKNFHFSNLKEIRKKEIAWVDRKYANSKYKQFKGGGLRNAAFQTYLVEIISKENSEITSIEKLIIYPVIWRNDW